MPHTGNGTRTDLQMRIPLLRGLFQRAAPGEGSPSRFRVPTLAKCSLSKQGHTPYIHVPPAALAKRCETGVQARMGTQTFSPSRLFNLAFQLHRALGKKPLKIKVYLNRSLEAMVGKNSVSSPCEPQSNDNTGLFSLPAPDGYLAKGVKLRTSCSSLDTQILWEDTSTASAARAASRVKLH